MTAALKSWPAVAKLNLFLHITGQREDGYHLLQTVFQFIDVADALTFSERADGLVRRVSKLESVAEDADLTVRAARLLQQHTGVTRGVDIHIDKRLPMGGGLGGGSSNAATTLVALNQLWDCGLDNSDLQGLGLQLGADVPVFVSGQAAWAEGVGERLQPVELPEPWYLVINPGVSVSTAEIFSAPELTRNCPPITIGDFISGGCSNVCEPVVTRRYPEIARAIDWLNEYAPARLTGTGSCIFAAFGDQSQAESALTSRPQQWQGVVARGMNRSPLMSRHDCNP